MGGLSDDEVEEAGGPAPRSPGRSAAFAPHLRRNHTFRVSFTIYDAADIQEIAEAWGVRPGWRSGESWRMACEWRGSASIRKTARHSGRSPGAPDVVKERAAAGDLPMPSRPEGRCRLRELRARSGLTQLQLAARSGLSLGTIRKLEEGNLGSTRMRTLVAASHALGLAPAMWFPRWAGLPRRLGIGVLGRAGGGLASGSRPPASRPRARDAPNAPTTARLLNAVHPSSPMARALSRGWLSRC